MSKFSVAVKRFGGFLKRNAFYLLVIFLIASVATVIALAVTYNQNSDDVVGNVQDAPVVKPDDPDDDPPSPPVQDDPVDPTPKQTFICPCNGDVIEDFSSLLVWSESMKDFRSHKGVDFASEDLKVFAACEGTVKSTGYNRLDGYYIVLEHANGYETKYMSLSEPALKVGDKVLQGDNIGTMATTQGSESVKNAHLHFEMYKDGAPIDPIAMLVLDEK